VPKGAARWPYEPRTRLVMDESLVAMGLIPRGWAKDSPAQLNEPCVRGALQIFHPVLARLFQTHSRLYDDDPVEIEPFLRSAPSSN